MRAICHREGLLSGCQLVSAAIPAKDLKPILKNLKAVAGDGRCTLIATDLEVGIRLDVQGLTIQEPGEAILPDESLKRAVLHDLARQKVKPDRLAFFGKPAQRIHRDFHFAI